jgi:hypothetical protein
MRKVMVRYKIKAGRVAENEGYIRKVFEQLERERPTGLRYASFKLDDGQSFVHLSAVETADGGNPLTALSAFKDFVARIKERCEEPPVTEELKAVRSYRFFGE